MNMPDDERWRYYGYPSIQYGDLSFVDTQRFGMNVYRIFLRSKKDLGLYDDGLIIARTSDISLVQKAEDNGYRLCDTLTYWKGPVGKKQVLAPSYWARPIEAKDRGMSTIPLSARSRQKITFRCGILIASRRLCPDED